MIHGISHWALAEGEKRAFPMALADANRAGFAAFEPAISLDGAITVETPQSLCEEYRRLATGSGLMVATAASGLTWAVSPTHPDAAVRRRGRDLQRAALQRAAWLGAKSFLVVPGAVTIPWDRTYPPAPYESALAWAGELVEELLPVAERLGIDVCLENVWNGLMYSPVELRSFVDRFAHPRLGVYLDVGNLIGLHQHPPHWIELLGQRIKRVHVKDFKLAVGGLTGFCKLGEGDVPWAETMAALRRIGYDLTVIAEVEAGSDEALAAVHAALEELLKR